MTQLSLFSEVGETRMAPRTSVESFECRGISRAKRSRVHTQDVLWGANSEPTSPGTAAVSARPTEES